MRYPDSYYDHALREVPGVTVRQRRAPGPPRNCRALLPNPPPPTAIARPWENPPTEIQPWVIDWLTPYQKEAWGFVVSRNGGLLFHPPGAGKTAAGLCGALSCAKGKRIIVITRATTRRQWDREIQRLSTLRPKILRGKTPEPIPSDVRCVILGWETLTAWVGTLIAWGKSGQYTVVFDEIHKAKDWRRHVSYVKKAGVKGWKPAKNITASAAKLSEGALARIGLSATPMPNDLSDLWSVLDLLEPGCWGWSLAWLKRYCAARPGQYGGYVFGKSHTGELKLRMNEICHRVNAAEVFKNMPPKRRELWYLSKDEQSKPVGFKNDLKEAARQGRNALFEMRLLEAAARKRKPVVDLAIDCVVEYKQKVTILTGRKKECESIAKAVEKALSKVPGAKLWWGHGGISIKERDRMVQEYAAAEESAVFVGTTDAFGEAIDGLQHTDVAFCCLLPWNGGRVEQMEGRFHRKSSTRAVRIVYVIAEGTVDEHVSDLVLTKLNTLEDVLDHTEARDIATTLSGLDDEDAIIASIINKMGT